MISSAIQTNLWVICSFAQDDAEDPSQLFPKSEILTQIEPLQSLFGQGIIEITPEKICFNQNSKCLAFISFGEELKYFTKVEGGKHILILTKLGKNAYILMEPAQLEKIDLYLSKLLFKTEFNSVYEPMSVLGSGSFSQVSLVKRKKDGKQFAVKTIAKSKATQTPQQKSELMNEINLLRRLSHKKVLQAYEFYESDGNYKLVLEYYAGKTLEKRMEDSKQFTLAQIVNIIKQVLEGLEYMHSKGVVHRDLKPENILFLEKDSFDLVIADIGLSQDINEEFLLVKCGTPGFVAPEILSAESSEDYCTKSDIFACGSLFYKLVTGKPLFGGKSHTEVLEENKKCKIDFTCKEFKSLPQQIQKTLERMLEIDPKMRSTAQQILDQRFYMLSAQDQDYICKLTMPPRRDSVKDPAQVKKSILDIAGQKRNSVCSPVLSSSTVSSKSSINAPVAANSKPQNPLQKSNSICISDNILKLSTNVSVKKSPTMVPVKPTENLEVEPVNRQRAQTHNVSKQSQKS